MIRKLIKYLKVVTTDVFIYKMTKSDLIQLPDIGYEIDVEQITKSKKKYFIIHNGVTIHQSFLFSKLYLLKLIHKKGPAIGDCVTIAEYKGKSIYPSVISHIAKEVLSESKQQEVFIIVNTNNLSSIRGIEKAGFKLHATIKAKRFLLFYYKIKKRLFFNNKFKSFSE